MAGAGFNPPYPVLEPDQFRLLFIDFSWKPLLWQSLHGCPVVISGWGYCFSIYCDSCCYGCGSQHPKREFSCKKAGWGWSWAVGATMVRHWATSWPLKCSLGTSGFSTQNQFHWHSLATFVMCLSYPWIFRRSQLITSVGLGFALQNNTGIG